jgi:hypothetical protein
MGFDCVKGYMIKPIDVASAVALVDLVERLGTDPC